MCVFFCLSVCVFGCLCVCACVGGSTLCVGVPGGLSAASTCVHERLSVSFYLCVLNVILAGS